MRRDIEHEEAGHDQAGDHAGDEQLRHRGLGERAVDDHREARRNENAERAARRERSRREHAVVVAAGELRQRDAADRGRGRDARSAHRGEDRAARDVGLQQPAGQGRDELREPVVDAVREAADAQDIGHEHEQRHRREGERVHAAPAHQAEAVERREAALHQQVDDRRHRDGERHRHPGRQQAEKQHRDDEDLKLRTHARARGNGAHGRGRCGRSRSTTPRRRSPSRAAESRAGFPDRSARARRSGRMRTRAG